MTGYYYLNFTDLNEEAKEELIQTAREDLEETQREELQKEAKAMNMDYEELLNEKVERHMCTFNFVFNV